MSDDKPTGCGFLVMCVLLAAVVFMNGFAAGFAAGRDWIERQAIREGHAHYDTKTKQFTWGKP